MRNRAGERSGIVRSPIAVAAAYLILTVIMTWPLARGLARDVPADLGDPLLNMWILDWMARGIGALADGSMSVADLPNANIFHPEPLALAFSEHLFGQALQVLPVHLLGGNIVLGYNLLFLSTYVLAGLGMYLLAFDLTGRRDAAFVAGLLFAFTPLRAAQLSHIQSLGTQWMPLALYGFRRYIVGGRAIALAGGAASLLMLGWSSGYYLVYFTPFVPIVVVQQMHAHGRVADGRMWIAFGAAAGVVAAGIAPFLVMYAEAQQVHAFERPLGEVIRFSADLGGYLTSPELVRLWGSRLRLAPKPEGEVFPGAVLLALSAAAMALVMRSARRDALAAPAAAGWKRVAAALLAAVALVQLAGLSMVVATGGFVAAVAGLTIRATDAADIAASLALATALMLFASARARRAAASLGRSWVATAGVMAAIAIGLSLGPRPTSLGQPIEGLGLYAMLFDHVPGFDGLRVPARFAMVAACFLCMMAAAATAAMLRRSARPSLAAAVLGVLVLVDGWIAPMPVNATWGDGVVPPARVFSAREAPAVYQTLAALPPGRVVAEFPFGDPAWELRYVYYATVHHQRLLNGYSGGFPRSYLARVAALQRLGGDPGRAWQALVDAGATHVVLHRGATTEADADLTAAWLDAHGARLVATFAGEDLLYEMP